jgi:acetyl-CoA carboxylase carboxyltransferase component
MLKWSSMGITQISAIMGSCVAGGAYLPIMRRQSYCERAPEVFLGYLVKPLLETIDNETLGRLDTAKSLVLLITKPKTTRRSSTK